MKRNVEMNIFVELIFPQVCSKMTIQFGAAREQLDSKEVDISVVSHRQSCGQHFRQGRIQDITQDFSQEVKVVCSSISRSGSVLGQSCDSPADRISDKGNQISDIY